MVKVYGPGFRLAGRTSSSFASVLAGATFARAIFVLPGRSNPDSCTAPVQSDARRSVTEIVTLSPADGEASDTVASTTNGGASRTAIGTPSARRATPGVLVVGQVRPPPRATRVTSRPSTVAVPVIVNRE